MIEVFGRATSSNVQAVMWAIAELGLPHARHDRGHAYGGLDTPEYRAMNPHALVPTIRDGDLVLWESAAIVRYLAARYGAGTLWPEDPAVRAPLDMWAEWIKTTFSPLMNGRIFWPLLRGGEPPADFHDAVATMKTMAGRLDARIGAGPWLAGAAFTFADILAGHLLYRYYALDFDKAATPHLDAYHARLQARPAFAEHVEVSFEPLRPK